VFSFNETTGERSADKGFLEAPVIINGELQTGLGGGVCQVSTTVFNAAYDTGLSIESRTNQALYISHYPTGRDATVNYPDLDLRFKNDTSRWLLLRTWVGSASLTVALYGAPLERRVESETGPLVAIDPPKLERVPDPSLSVGETVLEDAGEPSRTTSVQRRVYDAGGKLLYDTTWRSYYRSEPRDEAAAQAQAVAEGREGQGQGQACDDGADRDRAGRDRAHDDRARGRRRAAFRSGRHGSGRSSARAIASTSQAGTRVGRCVAASTHACVVHPSATRSPSRSIAYSNRKRAPRTSTQRAWMRSRSSNRAGTP
jgi:hypothetical protein